MPIKAMIWAIHIVYRFCLICDKMKIIIFILFIFTLLACSPTSSEKGPKPDAPKIVEKTPDTAFVDIEKGIDATF